jgi:hypothetical protein
MKHSFILSFLAISAAAFAQQMPAKPMANMAQNPATALQTAADPSAAVPAVAYRSVFKETSLGVEKDSADWRKANDEVGKFKRGHVDILKWEEQQQELESAKAMKGGMDKQPELAKPAKAAMPSAASAGAAQPKPEAAKPMPAPAHKH